MEFKDTIDWEVIDAPVPEDFFGDDVTRANLTRHGIKNGIITQTRVLKELREMDAESCLAPNSKYKGNVGKKIKWIEEFYFPMCLKEIQWFEGKFGTAIRTLIAATKHSMSSEAPGKKNEDMGNYKKGISEL